MGPIEVAVYGGGEYYRDIFNSVAMLAGANGMTSLVRLGMSLGLVASIITMAFSLNMKAVVQWFVTAFLIYAVMWAPKVQVQVVDELNPFLTGGAVANVPLGVGVLAGLSSQVGRRAVELSEQAFSSPSDMKYSERGMIYGARLVERLPTMRLTNRTFETNVQTYIARCVSHDVLTEQISMKQIAEAKDIWGLVTSYSNAAVSMPYLTGTVGESVPKTCSEASVLLSTDWPAEVAKVIQAQEKRLHPEGAEAQLLANGSAGTQAMHEQIFGASRDAVSTFRQALVINTLRRGVTAYSAEVGTNALDVLAETQAQVHTRNLQSQLGGIGEKAVPLLKIVVELMLIGIFPVLFGAFLLPKIGPMMVKGYVSAFIGMQAWGPLYVILNKIMMGQAVKESAAAAFIPGQTAGLTLSNMDAVAGVNADVAALAGSMLLAIPVIVGGIMRGNFGMIGSAESHLSNYRAGADSAAGAQTTGNFSFGNTAFDNHSFSNTSGNKFDTNRVQRWGSTSIEDGSGGMQTTYRDGSRGYQMSTSSTAGGIEASTALSQAAVQRAHQSAEIGNNLNSAASQGYSRTMSESARYAESFSTGQASRFAEGTEQRKAEQQMHSELERLSQDHSRSTGTEIGKSRALVGKTAAEVFGEAAVEGNFKPEAFGVGGGLKLRGGGRASAGIEASGSTTSGERSAENMVVSNFSDKSWNDSFSKSSSAYAQESFERSSSASQMSSKEKADTFASMKSVTDTASTYQARADRFEKVAEQAETYSQTFKQDYAPQFGNWAAGWAERNNVSSDDLGAILSAKTPEDARRYAELQREFAGEALDKMVEPGAVVRGREMAEGMNFSASPDLRTPDSFSRGSLDDGVGAGIRKVAGPSRNGALYDGPETDGQGQVKFDKGWGGAERSAVERSADYAGTRVGEGPKPELTGAFGLGAENLRPLANSLAGRKEADPVDVVGLNGPLQPMSARTAEQAEWPGRQFGVATLSGDELSALSGASHPQALGDLRGERAALPDYHGGAARADKVGGTDRGGGAGRDPEMASAPSAGFGLPAQYAGVAKSGQAAMEGQGRGVGGGQDPTAVEEGRPHPSPMEQQAAAGAAVRFRRQ